jgi:hypothetical protein
MSRPRNIDAHLTIDFDERDATTGSRIVGRLHMQLTDFHMTDEDAEHAIDEDDLREIVQDDLTDALQTAKIKLRHGTL